MTLDRRALYKISYGLFIVCSMDGKKANGQTSNTVFQVTSDPATIAISINKNNYTHECIKNTGAFTVSVLSQETPIKIIGTFGFRCGRDLNKFSSCMHEFSPMGIPYVTEHTVSYLEAKVIGSMDAGTHTVFLGEITDGKLLSDKEPMTYAYYHAVKNGKEPPSAPTFRKEDTTNKKKEATMKKYVCKACGWIYDPEVGDPDGGIDPGTAFEDIPEDWVCPVCGVGKDMFEETD